MMRTFILAASALIALGCGSVLLGTEAWFNNNSWTKPTLEKQASFDMSCDASKLTFTPLGPDNEPYVAVGVSGCDKKMKYLYSEHANKWIANTAQE